MAIGSSDLPPDLSQKVDKLKGELEKVIMEIAQRENINPAIFPMFRNHNYAVIVDSLTIHLVYTTEGVTSSVVSFTARDLRSMGIIPREEVIRFCVCNLGYKDIHYFGLPLSLADSPSEVRRISLEGIAKSYIEERLRPLQLFTQLGLDEAFRYLQNARARFYTMTPEGFADCKANCRNALLSALQALSGRGVSSASDVKEAVRILREKGILGKREEKFITVFGEFIEEMYKLLSKKGPHPPMPRREDAELALSLTHAVLIYLAERAIAAQAPG